MTGQRSLRGFSLVEVVAAIGIVSFAVLATFGLLSVATDTNRNAKDEGLAARLAANEFTRIRSLSAANFPNSYNTRYFDERLVDLGTDRTTALQNNGKYELQIESPFPAAPYGTGDWLLNAEVRFPIAAPASNQTVFKFTTVLNTP
jgi:type II secretory pathway pseudopilin PulG